MKHVILLAMLILPLTIFANGIGFWDVYNAQLENNYNYQKSILTLNQAKNEMDSYKSFWMPKIKISTSPVITFDASGLTPISMAVGIVFFNVFGAEIGVNFPFIIQNNDNWELNWGNPSVSLTREFFDESHANELEAQANYYLSLWSLENSKWDVLIDSVQNIFDWKHYQGLVNEYSTKVDLLQELYLDEKDPTKKENFHAQLLSSTNSLLNYENSLEGLEKSIPYSMTLYEETLKYISALTKLATQDLNIQDVIEKRMDVKAKKLQYESARERASLWFLPFVPNPSFSLNLSQVNDKPRWSISVSLSFSIFDKGSDVVQSFSRKKNEKISQLQLQNAKRDSELSLKILMNSLKTLTNNMELQKIEMEDSQQEFDTANELYKKGFESEDEMMLSKIEYQISLINLKYTHDKMILTMLRILKDRGALVGGEKN